MQAISEKMGLVCMGCPKEVYEPFAGFAKTQYNYTMKTSDDETEFFNENGIEFLPMAIHEKMWAPNCTFAEEDETKWDYCSVEKIVSYL